MKRSSWFGLIGWLIVCCSSSNWALAQKEQDNLDRDYRKELPRTAPTNPSQAPNSFRLVPGFAIQSIASEPIVTDPIAIAFDEFARMYVVEMRGYSEQADENLGRIRLLEDRNRDGFYESSTVFAEGLSWPTAIGCYQGGVFVGAAPNIYYMKDTDGDRQADVKKIVFKGFGKGNVQGLMNSFRWGVDNRLHGATSSSGANVLTVSPPSESKGDTKPLVLRGRDFSIDPNRMSIKPESGGAQHGLSFNRWGEKFVCSNSDHIQFVLYDDAYAARNPYVKAPRVRMSIAADGPQSDVFRSSPVEPWRIVRTRLRVKGIVGGPVEGGGTPAGYFTGATGVTIYRGDAWSDQYRGWAIVGDVGSNLVHRKRLTPRSLTYVANRVDEKKEFLTSSDIWFRPVQFANGPNGGLYVVDMYREVIEHPKSLPPVIKKHLDLTSGRDRGRIWTVLPGKHRDPYLKRKLLGDCSTEELAAELESENGWRRETAARLIYERQDAGVAVKLESIAQSSSDPAARIQAMHSLQGLKSLRPAVLLACLSDDHPQVRRHALKLSESLSADSSELRDQLCRMTSDGEITVRQQLAFSLGAFQSPARDNALAELLRRDGGNAQVRFAVATSLMTGAGKVLEQLLGGEFADTPQGPAVIAMLAGQIARQRRGDDVARLLKLASKLAGSDPPALQIVVKSLALKSDDPLAQQIAAATSGKAEAIMKQLVRSSTADALNEKLDATRRSAAVQSLQLGSFQQVKSTLDQLMAPAQPIDLQQAALTTAGAFADRGVAPWILERWPSLSPRLRVLAGDVLLSRESWTPQLLAALESKRIGLGDLETGRLRILAASANVQIASRAKALIALSGSGQGRDEVIAKYRPILQTQGAAEKGRTVFRKQCASCHQLEGVGHAIGPNLAAMRNRGDEAILLNVLAPNKEVNPQYLNYVIQTRDGRSLSGMIVSESATSLELKRADNKSDQVLRIDIEAMRSTGASLMPEGLEKKVTPADLADLIAYLKSLRWVRGASIDTAMRPPA